MPYQVGELKRKLRSIRRLEIQLRFQGNKSAAQGKLIWDKFFDLKQSGVARYLLDDLLGLDRDQFVEVLNEYYYVVYFQIYKDKGLSLDTLFDPNLLVLLELHPTASETELTSRFRVLAKKYHPDLGGDGDRFIELMEIYNRLKNK